MDPVRRKGRLILIAVIGLGIALALLILMKASSSNRIESYPFGLLFFIALAFNVLSHLARWLVTKNRRRTFLKGRFPFVVGLARLCGFVAFSVLLAALLVGLISGPPLAQVTLAALITGMLMFATLSLTASGILNSIIVTRHFQGTLAVTSAER